MLLMKSLCDDGAGEFDREGGLEVLANVTDRLPRPRVVIWPLEGRTLPALRQHQVYE